jgi:hypothetical membrane protein
MSKQKKLRLLGLYCGIVSPILWLGLIAFAGAQHPDYSHVTQYISELAERGSSTETLMRYLAFGFTGFLYLGFAATFPHQIIPGVIAFFIVLDGIGRMGAGVFPCDPGCDGITSTQDIHYIFASIGFSSGIMAALCCGFLGSKLAPIRSFRWFSVTAGLLALVSLLLMSWAANPVNAPGLFEHFATGILSIWLLIISAQLIRAELSN